MPTYLDPISNENVEITEKTNLYLVSIDTDTFAIKAISGELDKLPRDPTTNAKEYWLVDTQEFLSNNLDNEKLFDDNNNLMEKSLTLKEVEQFFAITPNEETAKKFKPATYFDTVLYDETEITKDTILYLVRISKDTFALKAIYGELDKLPSDTTTHAKEYWLVDTEKFLDKQLNNEIFFDKNNNKLKETPLTRGEVEKFFAITPNEETAKKFDPEVGKELIADWQQGVIQDWQNQGQNVNNATMMPQESQIDLNAFFSSHANSNTTSLTTTQELTIMIQEVNDPIILVNAIQSFTPDQRQTAFHENFQLLQFLTLVPLGAFPLYTPTQQAACLEQLKQGLIHLISQEQSVVQLLKVLEILISEPGAEISPQWSLPTGGPQGSTHGG